MGYGGEKGGNESYDKGGRGKGGRDNRGYDNRGNDKGGYDTREYDKGGNDKGGYGKGGYESRDNGYDKGGYGKGGYEKGDGKGGDKGKGGKGKKGREEKLVSSGVRGKIIKVMSADSGKKPSGFIKRGDDPNKADVYFDMDDVLYVEGVHFEELKVNDVVEFDVNEGGNQRLYAARIKKLPNDTPIKEDKPAGKASAQIKASTAGSLSGAVSLGGPAKKKGAGSLSGGISLRPGGLVLGPGGGLSAALQKKKEEEKNEKEEMVKEDEIEGIEWGRIVSVRNAFGFLQPLGSFGKKVDVFFRAADVVGLNCYDAGDEGYGLQISLPQNSNGYRSFWLCEDDEVSFEMSKDHTGKPCAIGIYKERKGSWRTGREKRDNRHLALAALNEVSFKDQVNSLLAMEPDEVLQNASLFKEVLDSPEFNPSHLYSIISMLASKELADDDRSATLYRLFLNSKTMQTSLRTTIIKQAQGGTHSGHFLEDCLRLLTELTVRASSPADLRGQLPLVELVEAIESDIREGGTSTKKGLPEEMVQMLQCLQKNFPAEVNLNKILGIRAPKKHYTAAENATELLEADDYRDMPILPTSNEMLDQAAFEIEENMRTYEKCEDYIQTHFMLLREDYIEPLRVGTANFLAGKHSPKDLHVYAGVKVVGLLSTWEGIVYRVQLPREQIRKVNWEKTKQLMYGSLLCLSDDKFETLIWATVWRRDEQLMSTEAQIDIRLPFEPIDDRLTPGRSFTCIENVTIYFEAYRHVLIALQNMRPSDVPFQDTLLHREPVGVAPAYVSSGDDMFHFHNVFQSCVKEDSPVPPPKCFNILQDWPETLQQSLDIDPSQLEAIQHSMTNQVGLIQGPPGTGKTWVGLKIVQALLDNTKNTRHSPVLVVCYTNHALDQFLEGIFKFCERIARIGSRSKSETLKDRNLKELVNGVESSKEYFQARRALNDRRDTLRENFGKCLKNVDKHVVTLEDGQAAFSDSKWDEFYAGYRDYLDNPLLCKDLPEEADDIDEEVWDKMMKAWLDTRDPSKIVKSIIPKNADDNTKVVQSFGDWEEFANDEGEEDAEAEKLDRVLDDGQGGGVNEDPRKRFMDLCIELKNPWLPYIEDHEKNVSSEVLTLSTTWQDQDLWCLPVSCRREIYRRWILDVHHEAREEIPELARMLERNADNRAALERDRKLAMLREMEVVGMTTTAVSKYSQLLKELRPEIVIVEEAAEVLEAHILTALHPRTQHIVLIGDHQQLRPGTAVYRLSKEFHLDVSLFERLIKNKCSHVTLEQQRRMHPKISRLMKPLYPNLRDHGSVSDYPEVIGVDARVFFLTHGHMEDAEGESHSKENSFESDFIGALCAHLVKSGYDESQITVLSPYLGQVRILKQRFRKDISISNVAIQAVDNFQGEENDIIVVSLVRSNRTKSMGFLSVENRVNVALTRAKHGMFIVGNSDMLKGHTLWTSIINGLRSEGCFSDRMPLIDKDSGATVQVKSAEEIECLLLDGGDPAEPEVPAYDRFSCLKDDPPLGSAKGKSRGGGQAAKKKSKPKNDGRLPPGAPDPRAPAGVNGISLKQHREDQRQGEAKTPKNADPEPPAARVEAPDSWEEEGEVLPSKDKEEAPAKSGKKQKQKGNQVVMRWG